MSNNTDDGKVDCPTNIDLPFFAYGIFKPGQLAYSKIEKYVEKYEDSEINYEMRDRDGVPILVDNEFETNNAIRDREGVPILDDKSENYTKGQIIYFKKNKKRKAYKEISNTISEALYHWQIKEIDGKEVYVLFGANPDLGSNTIHYPQDKNNYDGKEDPFFSYVIDLIESFLNEKAALNTKYFFELQKNYMLLWSAIDRYSHLKYNKDKESENRYLLSKEKIFKKALKEHARPKDRIVYSATNIDDYEFDLKKPKKCLNYYYTIRCNVVHRGKKETTDDISLLKQATEELLAIFKDVLKDTFGEKVD